MATLDKIRFQCPHCDKAVSVPVQHAGKKGKCPGCDQMLRIPPAPASSQAESLGKEQPAKRAASESEMTRLRDAAFSGETSLVEALLLGDFDVNTPLPNGDRLLVSVTGMGDARLRITKLLVAQGADVNCPIGGVTLLQWISRDTFCDNEATIEYLKSKGAVARPAPGKTPEVHSEGTDADPLPAVPRPRASAAHPVAFDCPYCGNTLEVTATALNERVRCPQCGMRPTPARVLSGETRFSPRAKKPPVQFKCWSCGTELEADLSAANKGVPCTRCGAKATVSEAEPDDGLISIYTSRTKEIGDWTVVEGGDAVAAAQLGCIFVSGEAYPCALMKYHGPPTDKNRPFIMRVDVKCNRCGNNSEGDGLVRVGKNDYFGVRCSFCLRDIGGKFIGDPERWLGMPSRMPSNTVFLYLFDGKKLSVTDVFAEAERDRRQPPRPSAAPPPLECPICRRPAPPQDGPLLDGLCRSCRSDSLAAMKLVLRDPFTCDRCNGSSPRRIGEIFKKPLISGSFFCKECYVRSSGK